MGLTPRTWKLKTDQQNWDEAFAAYERGDEETAVRLFTEWAEAGDPRASTVLGNIFMQRGDRSAHNKANHYIEAAHWYSRAISQGGTEEAHIGLAQYNFFGLGGRYQFDLAVEYLSKVVPEKNPTAALMLGELRLRGLGTEKNIVEARRFFSIAADAGYPAGLLGLARVSKLEKKYFQTIKHAIYAIALGIRLMSENKSDPRLRGSGGKYGLFRAPQ